MGEKIQIISNDFFASSSPDKEDCISVGLMSWIIIGLIMLAMVSCVCCVIACCSRNKVSKSMRTLLPRVMDGEFDLMRFRGWERHILTQHVFFDKETELLIYHWNSVIDDGSSDIIFQRQNCLLI